MLEKPPGPEAFVSTMTTLAAFHSADQRRPALAS
jgi:hypothetical protein